MKKLVTLMLLATLFVSNMFAQDIIVKRNSERIDAIVTEVSSDEVKYKKVDNQQGPTYVLKTSEILTIIYKNGNIETFEASQQAKAAETQQTQAQSASNTKYVYSIPPLYRTTELQRFCPEAYDYLGTAAGLSAGGSALLGLGIGGTVVGILGYALKLYTMGYVGLGIGVPCLAGGIPLLCVGSWKQRQAKEAYDKCVNEVYSYNDAPRNFNGLDLELQSGQDGLTFAIKF